MIPFKPHSLSVYPITDYVLADFVEGRDIGAAVVVKGMLAPRSADSALRDFGIEIRRPHYFYCELADAANFKEGYAATYGDRKFIVRGVNVYTRDVISHCRVALEEVTHALI